MIHINEIASSLVTLKKSKIITMNIQQLITNLAFLIEKMFLFPILEIFHIIHHEHADKSFKVLLPCYFNIRK